MQFLREALPIFTDLINNAILLVGLALIYTVTNYRQSPKNKLRSIVLGFIIGVIAILVMKNSWLYLQGVFFDTRSVLFVVTGLFFGPITTGVAGLIAVVYRITQGGAGVYSGVLTVITTASLGLLWNTISRRLKIKNLWLEYFILGLLAHIITYACFLTIRPWETAQRILEVTLIPYLTLYPIVTMFLAQIVHFQRERLIAQESVKKQQVLLQASIDSTRAMEVYAVDSEYKYLSFNEFHELSMRKYYGVDIKKGEPFLDYISHPKMKQRMP